MASQPQTSQTQQGNPVVHQLWEIIDEEIVDVYDIHYYGRQIQEMKS